MPEEGIYARIPIAELTLEDAYQATEDASFWDATMPPVLFHYQLSVADYYKLTVYQHRLLVDYLANQGLISGDT